jgi:hypothetical protein
MDDTEGQPAAAAQAPAAKSPRDEIIDKWFVDSFHREPVAQDTRILNYVREAVEDLKKRLAKG